MAYLSDACVSLALIEVYNQQQSTNVCDPLNQVLCSQIVQLRIVHLEQL